ncbi:trypsin-like serine peptidase [Streptomyces sp. WZ-12]|uniref:trypsin-like serine peptidase n=1 Tax=Streptomyces sp. WZ-12 TaxID=3030210 RepID=UPI00238172B0|nr:peptidase [Streptomyces sp. WZ-12]
MSERVTHPGTGTHASRRAAVAAAVVAVLTGVLAPSAAAAPAPGTADAPAEGTVAVHAMASTAQDESRVRAYWTPERIAALSTPLSNKPPYSAADGAPWKEGGAPTTTMGRLFFTDHGEDASCTATLVHGENGGTVVTAAHCLNNTDLIGEHHQWQANALFVPGYRDGRAPLGTFVVRWAVLNSTWLKNDAINARFDAHDQAFAVVGRNARGQSLEEAAEAAQGIAFDVSGDRPASQFGYPRAASDSARAGLPEYTGRALAYCHGAPLQYPGSKDHPEPAGQWGLPCVMGGGASGGPRLADLSPTTGRGTVVGVNTHAGHLTANGAECPDGGGSTCTRYLVGPQFTTALTKPLYDRAQSLR